MTYYSIKQKIEIQNQHLVDKRSITYRITKYIQDIY